MRAAAFLLRNAVPLVIQQLRPILTGGVSDCVEIALGVVSGWWNMTRSGDEIKMH